MYPPIDVQQLAAPICIHIEICVQSSGNGESHNFISSQWFDQKNIKSLTMDSFRRLRNFVTIFLASKKLHADFALEARMQRMERATCTKMGNIGDQIICHHNHRGNSVSNIGSSFLLWATRTCSA